ncbi:MAG TPA: methyltransferase domain-containing protein [Gaiellaceae bacterium]|nr:methyltransferase domain-containing protein [Gaiellaceae bacterium]
MTLAPEEVKSCCASVYSSAAARFLLGDSFHPGGSELTSRLIEALQVGSGHTVVDVASGPGTSARQLARESGCEVVAVDLAPGAVDDPRVRVVAGDAEALPLDDASMDGALCECALCTFPDKDRAAAELARVLRPGARLALSDMLVEGPLPDELRSLQSRVACIGDARRLAEIARLLERHGFAVERTERHDDALATMLDRIDARMQLAGLLGADAAERGRALAGAARAALEAGLLGYGVVVARR